MANLIVITCLIIFLIVDGCSAAIQAPDYVGTTLATLADFSFGGTPETQFKR